MRIALIAPPWTRSRQRLRRDRVGGGAARRRADRPRPRGHLVRRTRVRHQARLVSPLDEEPPRDAIGDPGTRPATSSRSTTTATSSTCCTTTPGRSGSASAPSATARPSTPPRAVHPAGPYALHHRRPSALVRGHSESQKSMAPKKMRWGGVVYNGIPMDRYPSARTRTTTCSSSAGPTRRRRRTWPSRRPAAGAGGDVRHHQERARAGLLGGQRRADPRRRRRVHGECPTSRRPTCCSGGGAACSRSSGRAVRPGDDRGDGLRDPVVAWRNGSVPRWSLTARPASSSSRSTRWRGHRPVGDLDPHRMRSWVEERFSAEAMVSGYEDVYSAPGRRTHRPTDQLPHRPGPANHRGPAATPRQHREPALAAPGGSSGRPVRCSWPCARWPRAWRWWCRSRW